MFILKNVKVESRDGKSIGYTTGRWRRCQLEGCGSQRIVVRWPEGRITYPCLKGVDKLPDGTYKIGA